MNKTGEAAIHIIDTAAVEWFLIMKLLSVQQEPIKHNELWSCTLYTTWLLTSTKTWCTYHHVCVLHWPEAWIWCENNIYHKNNGTRDHQNCTLIRPRSRGGLEQLVFWDFNRSMARDWRKFSSLLVTWSFNVYPSYSSILYPPAKHQTESSSQTQSQFGQPPTLESCIFIAMLKMLKKKGVHTPYSSGVSWPVG